MSEFAAAFDHVSRLVDAEILPTAVLGIASADGVLALDAFGQTAGRKARVEDHYRLFSVTKPLVGLVAARAVEQGRLSLSTPLTHALPGFGTGRGDVVRLRHLASHTSGITETPLDSPEPLLASLVRAGRDFPAGTLRRYSSLAFEGIAALFENATGRTWETELADIGSAVGASFTLEEDSHPTPVLDLPDFDFTRFAALRHPGAGVISDAGSLLALATSLLKGDGAVVRPATLEWMRRPLTVGITQQDPDPLTVGEEYGFTWKLRDGAAGLIERDVFGHSGWSGTQLWFHPHSGIAWVLLTNRELAPGFDLDALDNVVTSGL